MTGKFDNRINAVYQSLVEYKNTEKNPVAVVDGEINRIAADAEKRGMGGRVTDVVKGAVGMQDAKNRNEIAKIKKKKSNLIKTKVIPRAKQQLDTLTRAVNTNIPKDV